MKSHRKGLADRSRRRAKGKAGSPSRLVIDRWALDIDCCFFAVPTGVYYRYPQSGAWAVIGRLDKSGDVSGLAGGGTYQEIPKTGILSPEIPVPGNPLAGPRVPFSGPGDRCVAHSVA